jgi:hypothetical protein
MEAVLVRFLGTTSIHTSLERGYGMRKAIGTFAVVLGAFALSSVRADSVAPITTYSNVQSTIPGAGHTSAAFEVVLHNDGTITTTNTHGNVYDGVEDVSVNVFNDSSNLVLNSLTLTGADIFGFDGDGISVYGGGKYDSSGYAGPETSFTITNVNSGAVNFTGGLGAGHYTYFSLENGTNIVGSSLSGGTPDTTPSAPLPASFYAGIALLSGFGLWKRSRRQVAA